jgi:hypothetical protein
MHSIGDVMRAVSPELAAAVPGKWRDLTKE